jgi:hypothetical protein
MPASTRGLAFRLLALAMLVIATATIAVGVEAARHHHDAGGVYDDRCPLEALAAVDRTSAVVTVVTTTPVAVAAALVAPPSVVRPALTPAADTRLRAPPVR